MPDRPDFAAQPPFPAGSARIETDTGCVQVHRDAASALVRLNCTFARNQLRPHQARRIAAALLAFAKDIDGNE